MTIPAIAPQAPADETLNASREAYERIRPMTCEAPEPKIDDAEYHEGVIRRGIVNLRCTRGKTGLTGVVGRLQAAHLSGPRSDPDAALSGSYRKAPGFAGGLLLEQTSRFTDHFAVGIMDGEFFHRPRRLRPQDRRASPRVPDTPPAYVLRSAQSLDRDASSAPQGSDWRPYGCGR